METQDLIYLISCAVNDVKPDPERAAGMDLDALFKLASRHMLAATVAPALEIAGVKHDGFTKAKEHSALKNAQMDMDMETLFAELDASGIWYMPLKGIVLQHLYPVYGMRQMSDHDILIDAGHAEEIKVIMEKLGFRTNSFGVTKHDVYTKPPVSNFQMHRELFNPSESDSFYEYYRDVQKRLHGSGSEKHFTKEDFYLYVTAHEYRHYFTSGTGLRSLADTYLILQKETPDMVYVSREAEKMGMADFEAANRSLALHLFSGGELTEADREMLDYILSSGVYGTIDHRVENEMSKHGWGKLRYAMDRFLVPFSKKNIKYSIYAGVYPFFYQHKILLPFLPFYRTFRSMKEGRFMTEARVLKNTKK